MTRERLFCRQPDHDAPRMVCGRPLPCPYHTAIIDPNAKPVATVTIPVTADAALRERDRLASIGVWLSPRRKKRKR